MNNSTDFLNEEIKEFSKDWKVQTDDISDWHHTFWELYKHRIHLFIALCKNLSWSEVVRSLKHNDYSKFEWWFILQLTTREWQISYHLPMEYWDKCWFAQTLNKANTWDWHTSDDVLSRLLRI